MCLAIFKSAAGTLTDAQLKNGWENNDDGGGFAYVENGKVVVSKGHMKWEAFLAAYKKAQETHGGSPFLVHFRIRSMGGLSEDNTHPFPIDSGALIHNGTLDGTTAKYGEGPSDTSLFAYRFGNYLTFDRVQKYRKDWEDILGRGNKMVMLYDDGRHAILNADAGHWLDGTWFSNYSHQRAAYGVLGGAMYDDHDWDDHRMYH